MAKRWLRIWIVLIGLGMVSSIASCKPHKPAIEPAPTVSPEPSQTAELEPTFRQLESVLKAQQWRAADQETRRLMLKIADREQPGWIDDRSMARFPCDDLGTIDRLWRQASGGRFGFSVQQRIWRESGQDLGKMSDRVGWRQRNAWVPYDNITFGLQAPIGHLPSGDGLGLWLDGMRVGRGYPLMDAALTRCGIR